MGTSTDGLLFYGWCFDEGHKFPWGDDEVEEWWRKVNGYEPPLVLYDESGEYLNGHIPSAAEIRGYYDHRREWDKEHPLPFEVINYCYVDNPMYALAVRGTELRAYRGCPEVVNPSTMTNRTSLENGEREFRQLCAKHSIELPPDGPHWYLASYWG